MLMELYIPILRQYMYIALQYTCTRYLMIWQQRSFMKMSMNVECK